MGVRDLFFAIKARDETGAAFDKVKSNLRQTEGMAASTSERMRRVGVGMRNFGLGVSAFTGSIMFAFRDSLSLFDIQERAQAKVAQAVKSTGGAAGFAADELFRQASALQEVTRFGDEAILDGVTAQLLTFTNIAGEEFQRAQTAALDMATVLGSDLQSASIMLGKALNDPVKGLTAMSRAGVSFSEDQAEVIKSLAETGRIAEAQGLILDELAKQYGGQAEAAAQAGVGALDQLSNTWGDVKEEVGGVVSELLPPITAFFRTVLSGFQALPDPVKKAAVALTLGTAALGALATAAGIATIALAPLSLPFLVIAGAIAAATALVVAFWPEIENLGRVAGQVFMNLSADVAEWTQAGVDSVVAGANAYVNSYQGAYDAIKAIWGMLPGAIGDLTIQAANGLIAGVERMLNAVSDRVNTFLQGINMALDLLPAWAVGEEGLQIGLIPDVELGRLPNEFEGAAAAAGKEAAAAFARAFEESPFEAPDLGLDTLAEKARASAEALGQVPPAAGETVEAGGLLAAVLDPVAKALDDSGLGGPGSLASGARGASGAIKGLGDDLEGTAEKTEKVAGVFDGFGKETAGMLKDMFSDGQVSAEEFGDFLLSWADKLLDRLLDSLFDPLGDALESLFSNIASGSGGGGLFGGLFSGISSWFGGLFGGGAPSIGMDTGGVLGVSGREGIDRNVARFRVSNNEDIHVVKRGQPQGGGQVNVTIVARDPNEWKASKGRIARDLSRAVAAGGRYA